MNRFLQSVAEVFEDDSIGLDDDFRAVEGWCSLRGFGLLVLMENDWQAPVSLARFLKLKTVRDLYREAFLAFVAKVLGVDRQILSGTTKFGEIVEWDSVSHLRLVMEAEKKFGVEYSLERIPTLTTLEDFLV